MMLLLSPLFNGDDKVNGASETNTFFNCSKGEMKKCLLKLALLLQLFRSSSIRIYTTNFMLLFFTQWWSYYALLFSLFRIDVWPKGSLSVLCSLIFLYTVRIPFFFLSLLLLIVCTTTTFLDFLPWVFPWTVRPFICFPKLVLFIAFWSIFVCFEFSRFILNIKLKIIKQISKFFKFFKYFKLRNEVKCDKQNNFWPWHGFTLPIHKIYFLPGR